MQYTLHSRKGVSTAVVVVTAIVIVAVAAVAGFFLLTQPTSVTTQSNTGGGVTSSTYSPPTTTAVTSQGQGTTTNIGGPTTTAGSIYLPGNTTQLFSLFSAMTVQFSGTSASAGTNKPETETVSFHKTGTVVINGVPTTSVLFNFTSSTSTSNATLYYAKNGSVVSVSIGGYTFNGTLAGSEAQAFTAVFNLFLGYNGYFNNPTYYNSLVSQGTSTQTFGSVTMDVTTYTASSIAYGTTTIGSVTVSIGKIPNTNYSMVVYLKGTETTPQGESTGTYQLISASPA